MSKWTIRNYNVFLREARSKFGISQAQAREVYKKTSEHLGRKLYGTDVGKHPRITGRYAKAASGSGGVHHADGRGKREGDSGGVRGGDVSGGTTETRTSKGSASISSLAEFYDFYDGDLDYDYEEVESSADYEEPGGSR